MTTDHQKLTDIFKKAKQVALTAFRAKDHLHMSEEERLQHFNQCAQEGMKFLQEAVGKKDV